jgi:hypothetical protein
MERSMAVKDVMGMVCREPFDVVAHIRRGAIRGLVGGLVVVGLAFGMPDGGPETATSETTEVGASEVAAGAVTTGIEAAEAQSEAPATGTAGMDLGNAQLIGNWAWYGYRLNRSETNQIANLSLWNAVSGVSRSELIPYSGAIMRLYAVNWILTARNARSMGQCLAISYAGTGLIVGC